jgi:hypothetical protein
MIERLTSSRKYLCFMAAHYRTREPRKTRGFFGTL